MIDLICPRALALSPVIVSLLTRIADFVPFVIVNTKGVRRTCLFERALIPYRLDDVRTILEGTGRIIFYGRVRFLPVTDMHHFVIARLGEDTFLVRRWESLNHFNLVFLEKAIAFTDREFLTVLKPIIIMLHIINSNTWTGRSLVHRLIITHVGNWRAKFNGSGRCTFLRGVYFFGSET